MKRLISVLAVMMVLCVPAFALSDSEYLRMKKNSDFARADRELTKAYNEAKSVMSRSDFEAFKKDQRDWIARDRDVRAETFMEDGYSRVEAYTMATLERAEGIRARIEVIEQGLIDVRDIDEAYFDNGKDLYLYLSLYSYSDMTFTVSLSRHETKIELDGTYDYDSKTMTAYDGEMRAVLTFKDADTVNVRANDALRRNFSVDPSGTYKRHYGK
ncbi:MAG: DUF1311 domain-containing protein [Synergistaceae bacterium]|nr:DUF1311 domain-containing protein [Synergistaceae bacterium]MBR0035563.1 DUF1311 domain-containing protein [Synergistaceae bacterium]